MWYINFEVYVRPQGEPQRVRFSTGPALQIHRPAHRDGGSACIEPMSHGFAANVMGAAASIRPVSHGPRRGCHGPSRFGPKKSKMS